MTPRKNSDREVKPPAPSSRAPWLKQVRQLHLYLGIFFAPSIVFFALSGALQLFGLHEGQPGGTYKPPTWIAKLASIHKHQTLADREGPPPGQADRPAEERRPPAPAEDHHGDDRGTSKATLALKWFFLAMATGLIFTTLLGVYMAFKFNRSRTLVWSLLVVGTVIPAALIAMIT